MADVRRFIALGMPPELAKEVAKAIDGATGTYTDADARDAVKTKTEVAALDSESTAAEIVAALQA